MQATAENIEHKTLQLDQLRAVADARLQEQAKDIATKQSQDKKMKEEAAAKVAIEKAMSEKKKSDAIKKQKAVLAQKLEAETQKKKDAIER